MWQKAMFAVVCMVLSVGGLAQAQTANPSAAIVVSSAEMATGFDRAMHDRLVGMGFDVTVVPSGDVGGTFTRDIADTYDLLLISESIGSGSADALIGTTAPVMHNESYGWDNWFFTTGANMHWATGTSVDIVNAAHPIAVMARAQVGPMTFFNTSASWTTDSVSALAPDAEIIAQITDGGTNCAIVFAIEEGAQLIGGRTAPARSVAFSIPGNNAYAASDMTNDAWALFDAAVRWLSGLASPTVAKDPSPADTATDVLPNVVLSWSPGQFANTHDVYLGTNSDDVNDGVVPVSARQDANSYDPGLLAFGQTYFWRIDEVNAPPDSTVFKGVVWSFTVEPFAYAVTADRITATASSSFNANSGPEKTVDGSGLNDLDQHNTVAAAMWTSGGNQEGPVWIQYEFDKAYELHGMWVWNSNSSLEWLVGLGVKTATIEYSTDGATWMALENVPEFAQAPGTDDYVHGTMVDFQGAVAKSVKITCTSSWSGRPQCGLSEVRFFYIPVSAHGPEPATGAADVSPDTTLSWRAGREAASHEVYLGTDPGALTLADTVSTSSYTPAGLLLDTQYYWRVDEVNQAETPAIWSGELWTFNTADCVVVDDFESYTNHSPNRLFQTWIDGLGFSPDDFFPNGNDGNGTGAVVGYDPTLGSIMEREIVHGGRQSMPVSYDGLSETTRTFAPAQDWTRGGITTLVLFFQGDAANVAGELYVKINGTKVSYSGEAADLTAGEWKQWNIALPAGANLGAVRTLTIGVASGQGMLYIDDICLYRSAPAVNP